ncbi:MAG TPA: FHA domain-containing protein, partial [Candidatus Hydrogenedentes bacterium]|nr:FHA domain-containing protein [Candidatus Hydrogenedentota bacterium]
MPQLVIEQPGVPPMAVPVSGKEITFGRSEDNDVVLTAEEVSRYHARIVSKDGRFFIVDLKSLNGTYVNRQRITEQPLRHLDEIWLGRRCHLLYRDDTMFGSLRPVPEEVKDGQNDDLQRSIQDIRREMNQAGRDMTLMGRKAKAEAGDMPENPVQPLPSQEELVRMSRAY